MYGCDMKKNNNPKKHIGGVMVSVPASSAVDHGLEPRSGQSKDTIELVIVASPLNTEH